MLSQPIQSTFTLPNGSEVIIETGKLARQADGAVTDIFFCLNKHQCVFAFYNGCKCRGKIYLLNKFVIFF